MSNKAHSRKTFGVFLKTPIEKLKNIVGPEFHKKPLADLAKDKVRFLEGLNKEP